MIDGVAAMDRFLKLVASEPDICRVPGDGRLLEVGGHRGRAQVRAGQGDRQLDLHEGGRGEVRRARPAVPQVRRRRGRDGLRRGRPGRQPRAPQGDLRAGLPDPHRAGRLPGRGHHLRPQRLRGRDRHRGARVVRARLHRGDPLDQGEPPGRPGLRRHLQRLLLVPRQQPRARGDPRRLPLPRDRGRPRHGHRQRRRAGRLRRGRPRAARADRGRRAQPAPRRRRAAARDRRGVQPRPARRRGDRGGVARAAARRADHARAGQGHRRARRGRHRAAARRDRRARRPPDRGDRGPADGRHERRRRPLRRRQDVPPAGRQERAGHEEGGRLPHPVHRGGEARRPASSPSEGHQRHDRHGDGQGRRPRHRQEHRRRRAPVQQLRGHRPRRHGAGAEDPRRRERARRRHHRAVGADHALARRDGRLRRRDAAPGPDDPAAHRRRDDLARAHGRQGRPASTTARSSGSRTPRARCRPRPRCSATSSAPKLLAEVKEDYDSLREPPRGQARPADGHRSSARAANRTPIDWSGYRPPRRMLLQQDHDVSAARTVLARKSPRPRRAARLHRLAAVLQRLGDEGAVPRHPQQPGERRGRAQALRRRAGDARPDHRGAVADRATASSASSRPTPSATTSRSTPTTTATEVLAVLHHLRQQGDHRDGVPNRSLADYVAPKGTGLESAASR